MGHPGVGAGGSAACGSAVESRVLCAQPQDRHDIYCYCCYLLVLVPEMPTPRATVSAASCPVSPARASRGRTARARGGATLTSLPRNASRTQRRGRARLYAAPAPPRPAFRLRPRKTKLLGDSAPGPGGRRNETESVARARGRPAELRPGRGAQRASAPGPPPPTRLRGRQSLGPYSRPAESEPPAALGPATAVQVAPVSGCAPRLPKPRVALPKLNHAGARGGARPGPRDRCNSITGGLQCLLEVPGGPSSTSKDSPAF